MYRQILLTLDGSPLARAALTHAAELATGGAAVTLLQVIEPEAALEARIRTGALEIMGDHPELAAGAYARQKAEAEAELGAARRQLETAGATNVTTVIGEGLPGNVIVDEAARRDCGAIVMATRGHSGLGREVVGSVAEYVLRHAGRAAVVLVGPRAADEEAVRR